MKMSNTDNKINRAITVLLVVVAVSLVPWAFAVSVSLFAFDAPGSEKQVFTWLLVAPVWAYPVVAVSSLIGAIILKRRNRLRAALTVAAIPLAAIILWAIILGLYFGLCPAV